MTAIRRLARVPCIRYYQILYFLKLGAVSQVFNDAFPLPIAISQKTFVFAKAEGVLTTNRALETVIDVRYHLSLFHTFWFQVTRRFLNERVLLCWIVSFTIVGSRPFIERFSNGV